MDEPKSDLGSGSVDDALAQDILAHYGKRGMHWGVKTETDGTGKSGGSDPVKLKMAPGKKIGASGGSGQPASEDAKKSAAYKQIASKSGSAALSNKQLGHLNNRVKLDQAYSKMIADEREQNKGFVKKFIQGIIKEEGDSLAKGKLGPKTQFIAANFAANGTHGQATNVKSFARTAYSGKHKA